MEKPDFRSGTPASRPLPAVIFANWREVLNQTPLSEAVRRGYSLAIAGYLDYCRNNGLSVTLDSARGYVADAQRRKLARNPELWKKGLNWFFAKGRVSSGLRPPGLPSVGQADTGRVDWERRLIERLRLGHTPPYRPHTFPVPHGLPPRAQQCVSA